MPQIIIVLAIIFAIVVLTVFILSIQHITYSSFFKKDYVASSPVSNSEKYVKIEEPVRFKGSEKTPLKITAPLREGGPPVLQSKILLFPYSSS